MRTNRRLFLISASATVLAANLTFNGSPAAAQTAAEAELMKPGPLPEITIGSANAPVTVIEYASMTCPHCANFHINTFPKLKEKYIDTGKVRFIFREFPLDPLALAGFMLARCAGDDKFLAIVDLLFHTQHDWAVQNPAGPLLKIVKQAGFTETSFNSCLDTKANESARKMAANIQSIRDQAADKLKINSTPTFFINGKQYSGAMDITQFDKIIEPLAKS